MKKLRGAMILASLGVPTAVFAEIDFKGFGSVVGGKAVEVKPGEQVLGYTDALTFKRDSLLALQMDADMGDGLSSTMQFISRGSQNFDVNLEWAYLTYDINDSLSISAGRMRSPYYRYSDFIDVRYSYSWVSPPSRVYSFDYPGFDGLSLLYNYSLGPVDSTIQVVTGSTQGLSRSENAYNVPVYFEDTIGINWTGSWEWLTVRAGYLESQTDVPHPEIEKVAQGFQALGNGFKAIGGGFGQLTQVPNLAPFTPRTSYYGKAFTDLGQTYVDSVSGVQVKNDLGNFMGFGLSVDKDSLLIDTEWVTYHVRDSFGEPISAYYVTLGWRFGPTLVYGTLSREMADSSKKAPAALQELSQLAGELANESVLAATLGQFPVKEIQELIPGAQYIIGEAQKLQQGISANKIDTRNWNIGLRWDFHPSASFKVSYEGSDDRIKQFEGGAIRTAIDFVF
jgi:hypothetical protein